MDIRLATREDIPAMREIFEIGRQYQLKTGNLHQWEEGYPSIDLILEDMKQKAAHVCVVDDEVVGVFSLFTEPDPTYEKIDGAWLNTDEPYATIHRIASNQKVKGTGRYCLKWAQERYDNIRIDTHEDNGPMKYVLEMLGFKNCGVIYLKNDDPRDAYQYVK